MGTGQDRRHILCVPWRADSEELEALIAILEGTLRPDERCHVVPRPVHRAGRDMAPVVPVLLTIEHRLDGTIVALDGHSADRLKTRLDQAITGRWPFRRVVVLDVSDVSWQWEGGEGLSELRPYLSDYVDWAWSLIDRETVAELYGRAAAVDALERGRQSLPYQLSPSQTIAIRHVDGAYRVAPVAKQDLTIPAVSHHLRCDADGRVHREALIGCTQESLEAAWLHLIAVARAVETLRLCGQQVEVKVTPPPELEALRARPGVQLIAIRYEIDAEAYQDCIGDALGPTFDPLGIVAVAVPERRRLVPIMCYARSSACRWMLSRGARVEQFIPNEGVGAAQADIS